MGETLPEQERGRPAFPVVVWYMEPEGPPGPAPDPPDAVPWRVIRQRYYFSATGAFIGHDVAAWARGLSWSDAGAEVARRMTGRVNEPTDRP